MKKHTYLFSIFATIMVSLTISCIVIYGCSSNNTKQSRADVLAMIESAQRERDSLDKVEKEKLYAADMAKIDILKHKIDSIKTKYCKVKTDKYTGRTYIYPINKPTYVNSRNYIGTYLSMDSNDYNSDATLFLYIDYVGSDWIFWERAYFLFDGETSTDIGVEFYDKDTDVYYGGVYEAASINLGSLEFMNYDYDRNRLDIARSAINSKTISVKLTGQYQKIINCKINDFKPICEIYFMMNEIRLIEAKYTDEEDF